MYCVLSCLLSFSYAVCCLEECSVMLNPYDIPTGHWAKQNCNTVFSFGDGVHLGKLTHQWPMAHQKNKKGSEAAASAFHTCLDCKCLLLGRWSIYKYLKYHMQLQSLRFGSQKPIHKSESCCKTIQMARWSLSSSWSIVP